MSDVFTNEYTYLEKCKSYLSSHIFHSISDEKLYADLLNEYESLLSSTVHITNISDKISLNLNNSKKDLSGKIILDELTDLYNRRYLNEQLPLIFEEAMQAKTPISALLLDIDLFKNYNDCYGHIQGDDCLKKVSHCLKNSITYLQDFAVRYGGEEFLLILPKTTESGALHVAESIVDAIRALKIPHEKSAISSYVTISIGVTTVIPTETDHARLLIESADRALYLAKQSGRNCITLYKASSL